MLYITSTFTPSMVAGHLLATGVSVDIEPVHWQHVVRAIEELIGDAPDRDALLSAVSAVPTADMASLLTDLLGISICHNRQSLRLSVGDTVYMASLSTGKLPMGTSTLPAGTRVQWLRITVHELVPQELM